MASPVDANRVVTNVSTGVRPWTVTLPTGVVAGDLLIVAGRGGGAITTLLPTGWSWLVQNDSSDASDDVVSIIYKRADGTEGASLSWDMGFAIKGAAIAWRIIGAINPATQVPQVLSALFTTTANTANPPAISPTGGSKDYLFLAIATKDGVGTTTAAPAGYSNLVSGASSGGGATTNATVAGASKQATAASEDPGVFTHAVASTGGVAYVIAIHPTPPVKIETLIDDFATTVDKTVKWPSSDAAVIWDAGGRVRIPCTTSYWQLATNSAFPNYDLTSSAISVKPTIPPVGNGGREVYLDLQTSAAKTNRLFIAYSGGNLIARKYVGGTNTGQAQVAYDPVAHAYWRIRESAGTTYFDTSPDGITWTNLYNTPNPFTLTNLYASLNSGYFGTETAVDTFFDNVNVFTPLIDDFNRANGPIYSGAGSSIWTNHGIGNTTVGTDFVVAGNQAAVLTPNPSCVSVLNLAADFDLYWDCVVAPAGSGATFYVCITNATGGTWNGIGIGYDYASGNWYATNITNGSGSAAGQGASSPIQAGDTYLISKRGTTVSLAKIPAGGGASSLIMSVIIGGFGAGAFGAVFSDTTQRWDNLRGGPVISTKYGVVSAPFGFGAITQGRSFKTAFGSLTASFTFNAITAAQRKTFGTTSTALTFTKAVAGQRKTFGVTTAPFTFNRVTAARKSTFAQFSAPTVVLFTTNAIATTGKQTYFGVVAAPFIFTKSVAGQRKTFGVVSAPFIFNRTFAGLRIATGVITAPFTFGVVTSAIRKATGTISAPFVFSATTQTQRKTFATTAAPFTFNRTTAGQRKAFATIAAPFTFNRTTDARRKTFSSLTAPFVFSGASTGKIKTFGKITMPMIFSATTFAIGFAGPQQAYGTMLFKLTFVKSVAGQRKTFSTFAAPFTLNRITAGSRKTFSSLIAPFVFTKTSTARVTARGTFVSQIQFSGITTANLSQFGGYRFDIIFSITTNGISSVPGTVLNDADLIYLGTQVADAVYVGAAKVWP